MQHRLRQITKDEEKQLLAKGNSHQSKNGLMTKECTADLEADRPDQRRLHFHRQHRQVYRWHRQVRQPRQLLVRS